MIIFSIAQHLNNDPNPYPNPNPAKPRTTPICVPIKDKTGGKVNTYERYLLPKGGTGYIKLKGNVNDDIKECKNTSNMKDIICQTKKEHSRGNITVVIGCEAVRIQH